MPTAETPEPFPSLPTPTASEGTASSDRSYDELTRRLVPLPDSSHRPTVQEERSAETPRPPTVSVEVGDASQLQAALAALTQIDLADVSVALVGGTATLTGSVARTLDRDEIAAALRRAPGVIEVLDQLRIRTD